MKCIELIHLSPKTLWEKFWTTDDVGIAALKKVMVAKHKCERPRKIVILDKKIKTGLS